jgi:hypothetical protein
MIILPSPSRGAQGFGIPTPGQSLLVVVAVLAGEGSLSVGFVVVTAWLAAIAGDNVGYWIGRGGEERFSKASHSPPTASSARSAVQALQYLAGSGKPVVRRHPSAVAALLLLGVFAVSERAYHRRSGVGYADTPSARWKNGHDPIATVWEKLQCVDQMKLWLMGPTV